MAIVELDIAQIPTPVVGEDRHQCVLARSLERILDGGIIAFEVGVAVEHEKALRKPVKCLPDRPGGPQQPGAVQGVLDLQTERRAVASRRDDLLAQVAEAEKHPPHSLALELSQLVEQERFAMDVDETLGTPMGQRPEPGREPSGQYDCREHAGSTG